MCGAVDVQLRRTGQSWLFLAEHLSFLLLFHVPVPQEFADVNILALISIQMKLESSLISPYWWGRGHELSLASEEGHDRKSLRLCAA